MASEIQAVVVGDNNVGKTSLCVTFSTGQFPSLFTPMECNRVPHEKDITVDGETIRLKLVDTEGQEDYDDTRPESYEDVNVFLVCFSISSRTSLQSVKDKWVPEVRKHKPRTPIILVGCKTDLRRGRETENHVTKSMAKKMCKRIKAKGYVECGALKKLNVDDALVESGYVALGKSRSGGGCACTVL